MAFLTSPQLTSNYPVATTAELKSTIGLVDHLIQDGFLSDNDLRVLLPIIGVALDAHIEQVQPASATFTGTAGTTSRAYRAVPCYPLPVGSAASTAGKYINALPPNPPQGRKTSALVVGVDITLTQYVGGSAAVPPTAVTVADTSQELGEANFVTIHAPASGASVVTGVTYDIYCVATTSGAATQTYLVKTGVLPGATVIDGQQYETQQYVLPAHTMYGVDTSVSPNVLIPGPRTFLA